MAICPQCGHDENEHVNFEGCLHVVGNEALCVCTVTRDSFNDMRPMFSRIEAAERMADAMKQAQIQLQATQINWQEECLFKCNDIMTAALEDWRKSAGG